MPLDILTVLTILKNVADTGMTIKDLLSAISADQRSQTLEILTEVHGETATRLLKDAYRLDGDAQREMLLLAIAQLETLCTVTATRTTAKGRNPIKAMKSQKLLEHAWQAALITAIAYKALGNHQTSVERHTMRAVALHTTWAAEERPAIENMPPPHPGTPFMPPSIASFYEQKKERLKEFDEERAVFATIVETLLADSHLNQASNELTR